MTWYEWGGIILAVLMAVEYFGVKACQWLHGCDEDIEKMQADRELEKQLRAK